MATSIFASPIWSDVGVLYTPTFAGGSWSGSLPLTNLSDRRLHRLARSSSATEISTRFECDLKADRAVRVVALPKHTLSSGAKWRVTGRSSAQLFQFIAGEDIAARGGVFSRSGTATFVDRSGIVRTAADGVPRDGHWLNGERTILLEPARTNLCIRSEEFDTWTTQFGATVTPNTGTAPDGTTTADTITGGGANESGVFRATTFTGDGEKCFSVYLKAGTAPSTDLLVFDTTAASTRHRVRVTWTNGVPTIASAGGTGTLYAVESLANGWYRILFSAAGIVAANTNRFSVYPHNLSPYTGTVLVWGAQAEDAVVPSSYIKTEGTTVTRNADSLYFPFTATPQAMTVYLRGRNVGAYINQTNAARVLHIGDSSASTDPRFSLVRTAGGTAAQGLYDDGVTLRTANATPSPAIVRGDLIEHRGVLSAAWVPTVGISVNGATEVTGTDSASGASVAWSAQRIYLAGLSDSDQFAYSHVVVSAGVQTMDAMRASYYDSGWLDAWAATDTTESRANQNLAVRAIVPTTAPTMRYWGVQISDPSNSAGYLDLARLIVAGGYQPTTGFSEGTTLSLESDTSTAYTDGGNAIHDVRPVRRVARFVTKNADLSEAATNWLQELRRLGARGQVFLVFDPDDTQAVWQQRDFLAVPRELTALEHTQAAFGNLVLSFTEEL